MTRRINEEGEALVRQFEGCSLVVYRDAAGLETVGYGHRLTGDENLKFPISQEQAEELLDQDLTAAEDAVSAFVEILLNDNQFSALVSFTFNLGAGTLRRSTLLKLLNGGDFLAAADEFPRWVYAAGEPSPGLVARRAAERALFLKPVIVT